MERKQGHQNDKQRRHISTYEPSSSSTRRGSKQYRLEKREPTAEQLPATSPATRPPEYDPGQSHTSGSRYDSHASPTQNYPQPGRQDSTDTVTEQFGQIRISDPGYSNSYKDGSGYNETIQPLQTPHTAQSSEPRYEPIQKPARFFKVGCVFKTSWAEVAGSVSDDDGFVVTANGKKFYTKARRFVVVVEKHGYTVCLPLKTHNHKGISKGKRDYAAVYAAGRENSLTSEQKNMVKKPIAIVVEADGEKIDAKSCINFGSPSTVPHAITAQKLGRVVDDHLERLQRYFYESMTPKQQSSSISANQSSHSTVSKSSTPSTQYYASPKNVLPVQSSYVQNHPATAGSLQNQGSTNTNENDSAWPGQAEPYSDTGGRYDSGQYSGMPTSVSYSPSYPQQFSTTGYNQPTSTNAYHTSAGFTQSTGNETYTPDDTRTTTDVSYVPGESSAVEPNREQYQYAPTDSRGYYQYEYPTASNDDDTIKHDVPTRSTNPVGSYEATAPNSNIYQQHSGSAGAGRSHSGQGERYQVKSSKEHQSSRNGSYKSKH